MVSSETVIEQRTAARMLLFRVAERTYGCDIAGVREIIPHRRATRLPGAPSYVQGLINLRGTIVTVLDLGVRVDASQPMVQEGSIILATNGTRIVGVAVDEVMDVQVITEEPITAARGALDAPPGLVRGLGQIGDDVVIVVDIQALVSQVLL